MIIASKNTELKQKCHCSKAWKRYIEIEHISNSSIMSSKQASKQVNKEQIRRQTEIHIPSPSSMQ